VSYDSQEQLLAFADQYDVTYDLLSDVESAVFREFGILNTLISPEDPEQGAGRSFYGVPFPGVYVTDKNGVVTEKFFHRHYATRESAGAIRDSALGEILARHETPAIELGTDQVRISAFLSDAALKFESQSTIYVRFELEEGLHMYGRPLPDGYIASEATIPGTAGLRVGTPRYPATHPREFPEGRGPAGRAGDPGVGPVPGLQRDDLLHPEDGDAVAGAACQAAAEAGRAENTVAAIRRPATDATRPRHLGRPLPGHRSHRAGRPGRGVSGPRLQIRPCASGSLDVPPHLSSTRI
jgi:hypothetical protein